MSQYKMPNIDYATWKKCKHICSGGYKKFLVFSFNELEILLMHNHTFFTEIAHNFSNRKIKNIV